MTFPMDTVKVRLQVQGRSAGKQYSGMLDAFTKIVANEGEPEDPATNNCRLNLPALVR